MDKPANNDHPIHDLLRRRWSPRAFSSRPIPPESIRSLLEAARWAPSSYNAQPWRFLIATRDDERAFERMLGCLVEGNQAWARQAPLLMLTVARLAFDDGKPNRHAVHDVGQAAAHLTVQAMALGLFVHQMAGIQIEKIRETYGVPEDHEPVTAIAVGYPGDAADLPDRLREREHAERRRKTLDEIAFSGAWEEPAAI